MKKLNLITTVNIILSVSFVVGITPPAVFAQDNIAVTMDNNLSSMGNMIPNNTVPVTGNVTETESLPAAGETGYSGGGPGSYERGGGQVFDP